MIISIMNKLGPVYGAAVLNNNDVSITLLNGAKKKMSLKKLNEDWITTGEYKTVNEAMKASNERKQMMEIAMTAMKTIHNSIKLSEKLTDKEKKKALKDVAEQQNDILKTMMGMLTLKK